MDLLEEAKEAIDKIFGDTSIRAELVLAQLEELQSDLEMKIEALQSDLGED